MRLLYRASPWRALFAGETLPAAEGWPAALAPLAAALGELRATTTLAEAHAWQPSLVAALVRLEVPAGRISQLISDHNAWLYRRAIALSLDEMRAQGWGEPPVAYCVLTLGSGARHESLLGPDQDNAMILDDYPDADHTEIDGFFQSLGERFTARLDAAGIPLCNGHVMARWPMWRKRLSEWQAQLAIWSAERRVKRVQQANILLDFHPVHGERRLARALSATVTARLPRAGLLLDEMAALLDETPVALDRFGRLTGGGSGAPHGRAVNLKHGGLLPLVGAVRLLALRHGVPGADTRLRLAGLAARGVLARHVAHDLGAALERLQARLLTAQQRSLAAGGAADGWVDLACLEADERLLLRHDLQTIRRAVRRLRRR